MEDCIFCKVAIGEMPSYNVYEDELFYGILDIYPTTRGHTLIIPKKHYTWVYEVPEFAEYWSVAKKVLAGVKKALQPEWIQFLTHGVIPHAHIHIIPRYEPLKKAPVIPPEPSHPKITKEEFEEIATKIKASL